MMLETILYAKVLTSELLSPEKTFRGYIKIFSLFSASFSSLFSTIEKNRREKREREGLHCCQTRAYRGHWKGKNFVWKIYWNFPLNLRVLPAYLHRVMPSFSDFKYLQKVSAKCHYISDEKNKFFLFDK